MTLRNELVNTGGTTTGFRIPPEIVDGLGGGKRPKVRATINGYVYRGSVAPMKGEFWLGISAEVRAGARIAAGDQVEFDLELDTEPREVAVPPDFAEALDGDPAARRAFERMAYSHRKQHVLAIEGAKAPETRRRRIDKALEMLRG